MLQNEALDNVIEVLDTFRPVTLDEMNGIRLMNRLDTKYILSLDALDALLRLSSIDYRVQEVQNERNIAYRTIYLDTLDKEMYRLHLNGKAVREKIRVRTYIPSCLTFLEVKNKNNKGRTDKKRIRVADIDSLWTDGGDQFLSSNAWYRLDELLPQLENNFRRITLVNNQMTERLTIDTGITFRNIENEKVVSLSDLAVVELKRDGRTYSPIHETLHDMHIRPNSFSKYCMGCALTDETLKQNRFKPKIRRILQQT